MSNTVLEIPPPVIIPTEGAQEILAGQFEITIEPLLAGIKQAVDTFTADVTTEIGREEIKSFAYKLARSRVALDDAGKAVNAKLKEVPKKIDANRRRAWICLKAGRSKFARLLTNGKLRNKRERTDTYQ